MHDSMTFSVGLHLYGEDTLDVAVHLLPSKPGAVYVDVSKGNKSVAFFGTPDVLAALFLRMAEAVDDGERLLAEANENIEPLPLEVNEKDTAA